MIRSVAAVLVLVLLGNAVQAQPKPRLVKLTLTPAAPPTPALKYHLLPWAGDLRPGNGAVFYQRAHTPEWYQAVARAPDFAHMHELLDQPWSAETAKRFEALLALARAPLNEIDLAARCDYVDWQLLQRFREETFALPIPDVQNSRIFGSLLALRARAAMHGGDTAKAVSTLQTGLALSRDLAKQPLLISGLVGAAIAHLMLNRAEELIQQPTTPNLYWALTDLPEPLIDLRHALHGERIVVDSLFPEIRQALRDPELPPISADLLRQRLDKLTSTAGIEAPRLGLAAAAAVVYPRAKAHFLAQGYPADRLDRLAVTQVVLMYEVFQYDRTMDEFTKLANLPYWQARPLYARANAEWKEARKRFDAGLLVAQIVPSIEKIALAQVRLQRRLALLRNIEALRLYAAAHKNELPESLDELRELPLPPDPYTGKAFVYQRQGAGQATLEGPAPAGETATENNAIRYEITLAAAGKR